MLAVCVHVYVQFRLVMHYLSEMTEEQTLVMYSGHPLGLFPSLSSSPRAIITNGMVINKIFPSLLEPRVLNYLCLCITQVVPNYSSREQYEKMFALGVSL